MDRGPDAIGGGRRDGEARRLDPELVIEGFARHAAIFDHAAVSPYTALDGEHVPGRALNGSLVSEIGGYVLEARRTLAWEPIVELLAFLAAENRPYFDRLMRGCVRLSNAAREEDGLHDLLDDDEQHMFDLACDREARRERQGYVMPAQAYAFLRGARDLRLDADRPPRNPIARAYFRAIEPTLAADTGAARDSAGALPESSRNARSQLDSDMVAGFVEILREADVLTPQPRALLGPAERQTSRRSWVEAHVGRDPASAEALGFLANAIMAGCTILERPFTAREAADGASAMCNLGLENWPPHWSDPDLVTAFQVGWTILHRDVCMHAAAQLIDVLAGIRCRDRDIHLRLEGLRHELMRHAGAGEPWRAGNALDALIMQDAPSWAALRALIDECPVIHAALGASRQRCRAINPADFEFISRNGQIAAVREFIASLPSVLTY